MASFRTFCKAASEAVEFRTLQIASHSSWADAGAKEALVGVDVAHPMQELLVEQGGLNSSAAAAEKGGEVIGGNAERLPAGALKGFRLLFSCRNPVKFHASEAPWIDKAQFPGGRESKDAMGMRGDRRIRIGDQQAACHTQMNDPL